MFNLTITRHVPSDLALVLDWFGTLSLPTLAIILLVSIAGIGALASRAAFSADRY